MADEEEPGRPNEKYGLGYQNTIVSTFDKYIILQMWKI